MFNIEQKLLHLLDHRETLTIHICICNKMINQINFSIIKLIIITIHITRLETQPGEFEFNCLQKLHNSLLIVNHFRL